MPNIADIFITVRVALCARQIMFGDVAARYGPFRLHKYAIGLKSGRLLNYPRFAVVVGELAVPLFLTTHEYSTVVRERTGLFRQCVSVGEIPIKESSPSGLYAHVDRWLKNNQTRIDCFAEQLTAASDVATGNLHQAKFYRKRITRMETEHQIVSDAFHAFMLEYPSAAIATKHNAAKDAREARRVRKTMRKAIWAANKILK